MDIDAELEKVDKETEAMKEKATKTAATSSKPAQKIDAKGSIYYTLNPTLLLVANFANTK